ncbi:O-antigen ligase family protein [Marinobacter sp. BGYM27]|uniref:O-antigen ligase family protein n=1 Tax=Marinobacter sp. BGYM27 TaxID=2975597 RepID=UPI0021A56C44|nr:O-antigen ligase family protein [Marinobacter sp. BGYM27]MDG5499012.1 O-antigen ligase family protein [Marinobacter sp. BGYM27]
MAIVTAGLNKDRTSSVEKCTGHSKRAGDQVSGGVFWLYMYFLVDFFLHLSQRISFYGQLRPTLLLVVAISLVLYLQRHKLKGRAKDPVFQAIFILLGYVVLSVPLVEFPGSVVKNNLPEFVKAIVFLFFTALIVDSEKRIKIFLCIFIVCQVFRILEPLYLHITEGYWGDRTYIGEGDFAGRLAGAPSDVINPNGLGFIIATTVPFLHYMLFGRGKFASVLYLGLMPVLLYALILTMSRGAFLALLVVAWMVFKSSSHKLVLILVAVVIVIGGWSVMTPIQKDRYLSLISSDTKGAKTTDGRIHLILHEFELGFERPIVGHGLGTTPESKYHSWGRRQASHNMYGELIIELGLIGFVLFLRFIIAIYRRFRENQKRLLLLGDANPFLANLNKALLAVFWMYVVYSLNYYGLSQYYWYLLGGITIAFGRVMDKLGRNTDSLQADDHLQARVGLGWKVNRG